MEATDIQGYTCQQRPQTFRDTHVSRGHRHSGIHMSAEATDIQGYTCQQRPQTFRDTDVSRGHRHSGIHMSAEATDIQGYRCQQRPQTFRDTHVSRGHRYSGIHMSAEATDIQKQKRQQHTLGFFCSVGISMTWSPPGGGPLPTTPVKSYHHVNKHHTCPGMSESRVTLPCQHNITPAQVCESRSDITLSTQHHT